ncbi:MAG TPA: DNA gyrase inhibitor YacG [Burkholderiales bacterium]
MSKTRFVRCPRCNAQVVWTTEDRYRPFCSERCKLIDLGDWAMEKYRVGVEGDKSPPESQQQD